MNFSVNIQVLMTKKSIKYDQKNTLLFISYRETDPTQKFTE